MKHILAIFITLLLGFSAMQSVSAKELPAPTERQTSNMKLAMISDYSGIADQSFNQTIYEACRIYAQSHGTPFTCFQPVTYTSEERANIIMDAVKQGCNVIVTPGDAFVDALKTTAPSYPDVTFIALDVSYEQLGDYAIPSNFYCVSYKEELSGYMAGYATVRLGYKKIGYLGGMDVPSVKRYGYGFVQGVNDAAKDTHQTDISLNYAYAGQFDPDGDITDVMDAWYGNGTEIVFACGGALYESVAEAAEEAKGKIIGVDVDQSGIIDRQYGKGITVTSAMKDLSRATQNALENASNGTLQGGKVVTLGLVGETPDNNYVKLPIGTTQWNDRFTQKDYQSLVASMFKGTVNVSNDITKSPSDFATNIAFKDKGKIK